MSEKIKMRITQDGEKITKEEEKRRWNEIMDTFLMYSRRYPREASGFLLNSLKYLPSGSKIPKSVRDKCGEYLEESSQYKGVRGFFNFLLGRC